MKPYHNNWVGDIFLKMSFTKKYFSSIKKILKTL